MVIAHAVVAAEAGKTVTVLIDDGPGARTATAEISRLQRLQSKAAAGQHIPDKAAMRTIYTRLRSLDDGLPPIERTNLLRLPHWR